MPLFDFECPSCHAVRADVMVCRADSPVVPLCGLCNCPMRRMIAAPAFKIEGFNAKNGYSSHSTS